MSDVWRELWADLRHALSELLIGWSLKVAPKDAAGRIKARHIGDMMGELRGHLEERRRAA